MHRGPQSQTSHQEWSGQVHYSKKTYQVIKKYQKYIYQVKISRIKLYAFIFPVNQNFFFISSCEHFFGVRKLQVSTENWFQECEDLILAKSIAGPLWIYTHKAAVRTHSSHCPATHSGIAVLVEGVPRGFRMVRKEWSSFQTFVRCRQRKIPPWLRDQHDFPMFSFCLFEIIATNQTPFKTHLQQMSYSVIH